MMEKIRADRLVLGYAAGLAGTVPMTIAMDRLWRLLPERQRYPLPPREIMAGVVPGRVQEATSERGMRGLTLAAHFAFGGAAGALLGALPIARRHETGAAYGVLIWTVSYMGWIPALRILKPASAHPVLRSLLMVSVHLIWGAATAGTLRQLEQSPGLSSYRLGRECRGRPGVHRR